jgi:RNA polymerase sigma-70 factor (ECF subfamily)
MSDEPGPDEERARIRAAVEGEIRGLLERGDLQAAATATLTAYGAELYGFLHALAHDDDLAAEAFATFGEGLWRALPAFRWESSLRTWSYAVARNALHRVRRDPHRRADRNVALSDAAHELVAQVRTSTLPFVRTEIKDGFALLRARLDPDDHAILILRIDRKMSWRDIARAMPGGDEVDLDRRAAALRKRFERAKDELRALAVSSGLFPTES